MSIFNSIFTDDADVISGLTPELKCIYIYNKYIDLNKSIVFVASSIYEANKYYQILLNYTDDVLFFPMDDFLTSEALAISPELKMTRLETIKKSIVGKHIIVTNLMGYLRFLPPKKIYEHSILNIKLNNEYDFNEIVSKLYNIGYKKETIVNKTGEMAVRGFVLDLFPITFKNPIRIEFWGDSVDRITEFDIDSQLTKNRLDNVIVYPCSEFLTSSIPESYSHRDLINYEKVESIVNYLDNPIIFYDDYNNLQISYQLLFDEMINYTKENNLPKNTKYMNELVSTNNRQIYFIGFDNKLDKLKKHIKYSSKEINNFKGNMLAINIRLNEYLKDGNKVIVCLSNRYKVNKLIKELDNDNLIATSISEIEDNKINLIVKKLYSGFIINNLVVISEKELFDKKEENLIYKTNFKYGTKIRDINKLKIGDYIVHSVHGIGIYRGIKTLEKNRLKKDYLLLEYKDADKLYIPVENLELISKYSSNESIIPKLNKLGGTEWEKTKLRVKKKIESIAEDLLKLYSEREMSIGYSFKKDTPEQFEFEKEFPYEETPDQLRATEEIKKDMEKQTPMDRLLCGDVGYGKTEVAFRAIFKALMSNMQVALLCPTTILSSQHYNNAIERFKSFPINIALLNRFVPQSKQKQTLNDVKEGKVDLLIGTHRILSEDVKFKRLGLLIIDEEQRFGVKHKEKIKSYKTNVDVLTLSATPIPRTLQMSMTGVRSLSLIETPPINRYPIQTYVLQENNQIIKDAIYKELAREGQIFILYNNISKMEEKAIKLKKLVPEARIVYAHGRMEKRELEDIMFKFMNHEFDILLCTTIIETGIDIPTVNTLIIMDADHFGLSQLYQIRGRVGRSNKIAYCYLMYDKGKILNDIAVKRLKVIKEFTELGSGFAIAMRDLSIRGAGDILGSEQSGFVDSVGVELFLNMLNDEVNKLKGKYVESEKQTTLPLVEVETTIDDKYAKEEDLKIEIHKKINQIDSKEKLESIKRELQDRFGILDESVIIYMYEELFEHMATNLGITNVNQTKNFIAINLPPVLTKRLDGEKLFMDLLSISRKFRFSQKLKNLVIILDTINLDKHFIYYLVDMIYVINNSIKG